MGDLVVVEEKPVFNLRKLSWIDEKMASIGSHKINKGSQTGDIDLTVEGFGIMESHIAKCLISVPSDWLVDGAPSPDSIDWSDKDSFQWLIGTRFESLISELTATKRDSQKK